MNQLRDFLSYLLNPRAKLDGLTPPENGSETLPPPPTVTWRQVLAYPPLTLGILLTLGLILVVWFAPSLASYDPYLITQSHRPYYDVETKKLVSPPFEMGPEFPLGTDQWGNDLLSMVLYGARVTLIAGLYITLARILLGAILGALAGWYEDTFIDRLINGLGTTLGAVPVLLSSIVLIYALDIYNGLWVFVVALSILGWFETAQLVRGEVMRIKRTNYVEAAEAIGLTNLQVVVRHVLPNVLSYLIVIMALEMGAVLLLLAELAFLGVFIGGGTRYNDDPFSPRIVLLREVPEWGAMVAQGARYIRSHPNMVLVPGFAFFISITAVNALGEGLRWMFTRWPFSTGSLLKKRSLVIAGALVLVSAFILNQTSPRASFGNVSSQVSAENVWARVDVMQRMRAESPGDAGESIAKYIASEMDAMGMVFGWRSGLHPAWEFDYETVVTPLLTEPVLATGSQAFTYGQDFALAPDQAMSSVSLSGSVLLVNPQAEAEDFLLEGRIAMTLASDAPVNYSQFVASQGGLGLLLVADSAPLPCNEVANMPVILKWLARRENPEFGILVFYTAEGEPQPLPTLMISPETALALLEQGGLDLSIFEGGEWAKKDLHVSVSIDLQFGEGERISVHNAVGYRGGYDIDNAHETVLLFAPYDSSTGRPEDLLSPAMMLEMLRAWHDSRLDPRRSFMLIAWDRAGLGSPGAQAFMDEIDTYRLLTPAVPARPVEPIMIWDLSMPGAQDGEMLLSPWSDGKQQKLLGKAARDFRTSIRVAESAACQPDASILFPSLSLMPADDGLPSDEFIEKFGGSVSLGVLEILRLPNY